MSSISGQRSTIPAAVLGSRSYARLSIVNGNLELRNKTASKLLAIGHAEAAGSSVCGAERRPLPANGMPFPHERRHLKGGLSLI